MLCKVTGSNKYYARFTDPGGKRICRSTRTENRKLAQEFEDKLKEKLWRAYQLGQIRRTWAEAVTSYRIGREFPLWHLRILDKYCKGKSLDELADVRDSIIQDRLTAGIKKHRENGVSKASINKTLAIYRAILLHVQDKGWISNVSVKLLPESSGRIRWISREEANRLIEELPSYLKDMVRFALATGLRQENVVGLEWSRVDLERRTCWIDADDHKNNEPHIVPLNAEAILVLRRCEGIHKQYVFGHTGKRLWRINNHAWRTALKRAGIENFRVHDLRHTWASWHVQSGTPLPVLQKLGGWKTLAMVLRYAHLGQSHVSEYADNICKPKIVKELAKGTESEALTG